MTNEWEEYLAYTLSPPKYECKSKQDTTYLGRFTTKMIYDFIGFNRIFTILTRGFCLTIPTTVLKKTIHITEPTKQDKFFVLGVVFPTAKKPPVRSGNIQAISGNCTKSFPI